MAILDRAKGVPEEFVVQMASTVELDISLKLNNFFGIFLLICLQYLLDELVQVVDIRTMVLAVVEFHQMATDYGFKSSQFKGQGLELYNSLFPRSGKGFLEKRFGSANHISLLIYIYFS